MELPAAHRRSAEAVGRSGDPALLRWAQVVEVEDLLSAVQARNPQTLTPESRQWSQALDALSQALRVRERPPRTLLVNLAERITPHLQAIVARPRRRLRRIRELRPLHQLRQMDARCRRWYARQPGATAQEKAGRRRRLLGVRRVHSVETVENRVAAAVVHELHQRTLPYLKRHGHVRHPHVRMVRALKQLCRAFRADVELSALRPWRGPLQPTNVLLRDVHYRVIWEVWTVLRRAEERARLLWARYLDSAQSVAALAALARLAPTQHAILDGLGVIPELEAAPAHGRCAADDWPAGVVGIIEGEVVELDVVMPEPPAEDHAGPANDPTHVASSRPVMLRARWDQWTELRTFSRPLPAGSGDTYRDALARWLDAAVGVWVGSVAPPGWARPRTAALDGPTDVWAACVGGPWTQSTGATHSEVVGQWRRGSECAGPMRAFDPRDADATWLSAAELWREAQAGVAKAARGLAGAAFGTPSGVPRDAVLAVPDASDPLVLRRLEDATPPSVRRWQVPRSVAIVLELEQEGRLSSASAVAVLSLGGPTAELNVLRRDVVGKDTEWSRWPGTEPLRWTAESMLDEFLRLALVRAGKVPEVTPIQRLLLRGDLRALALLQAGQDTRTVTFVEGQWQFLPLASDDLQTVAVAACNELAGELAVRGLAEAPSADDGPAGAAQVVVVEGWPLKASVFRDALTQSLTVHPERALTLVHDPATVTKGCLAFIARHRAGRPTWKEILPALHILAVDRGTKARKQLSLLQNNRALRPGDPPLTHRRERVAHVPAGKPFRVDLPIQQAGSERGLAAVWRADEVEPDQDVEFGVEIEWEVGRGGPVIWFVPSRSDSPVGRLRLDWAAMGDSTEEAPEPGQSWPAPIRPDWLTAQDVARVEDAWATIKSIEIQLRSKDGVDSASLALRDGLKALGQALPCPVHVRPDPTEPSWTARVAQVSDELAAFFGLASEPAGGGRRKRRRKKNRPLNKKAKDTLEAAAARSLASVAGKFGAMCAEPLVEWVADRLAQDAHRNDTGLIMAAGRLLVRAGGVHDRLKTTLVERGEALAGGAWAWAWASALLAFEPTAPSLSDEDVARLVERLVARGDTLAAKGSKAQEATEIALALVGLMRVREARHAEYGPGTEWSRGLAAKVAAWRSQLPGDTLERRPRFRLDGGRNVWVALEELIEGRRPVLLNME